MFSNEFHLPGLRSLRGKRPAQVSENNAGDLIAQHAFGANPGNLRMYLYLPPGLPRNAPLVVVLHGCTQSASTYDTGAGWSHLATEAGFAVLAPQQVHENSPNLCFNWFQLGNTAHGQGEAASIHQMIEWAVIQHGLDRNRIYITGLSAGGAMAAAMLAAYPEVFAGGAIIAGLPAGVAENLPEALASMRYASARSPAEWAERARRASQHTGPWPRLSIWQGSADATVHPSNAEALVAQWTHLHGVSPVPSYDVATEGYRRRTWQRSDGTVMVEAFSIDGMGHGTPIGESIGQVGPHFADVGISSTAQIAAFWGIAEPATRPAFTRRREASTTPVMLGLQDTIRKALQSAGLLKA